MNSIKYCFRLIPTLLMMLMVSGISQTQAEIRPQGYEASVFSGYWQGGRFVSDASYSGFSLSYHISRLFSLELQQGWVPTQVTTNIIESQENEIVDAREDLLISQGSVNLQLHLSPHRLTPYFNVGIGWLGIEDDMSMMSDLGIGFRYFITPDLALRAGFTMWIGDYNLKSEPYEHFSATFGIAYNFMGKKDIDKDGIKNIKDKCPTKPEDKDGFEDSDGCPEKDNDEDKILDKDDKCPNQAEDKDGDKDEDGCPDVDDDGDGIVNEEDQCKDEPEDIDNFKDEDGCPDTDNDGDKILDKDDKCPNKKETYNKINDKDGCPEGDQDQDQVYDFEDKCKNKKETYNGFKDEDGCPDKVAGELAAILGYQAKLSFKKGKLINSRAVKNHLDSLAKIINKYKEKISIQVAAHAKKKSERWSEKRAEDLKNKLLERGVSAQWLEMKAVGATSLPKGDSKVKNWVWLELVVKKSK